MTVEEAALLAQILADPGDDTVRLVYADWLDENGQPERAEFIRLQIRLEPPGPLTCSNGRSCALTRRGHELKARCRTCGVEVPCRPGAEAEWAREVSLWAAFADLWALPLARLFGFPDTPAQSVLSATNPPRFHHLCPSSAYDRGRRLEWEFCRGLIERVSCPAADWLDYGDAARAVFPIRTVRLLPAPRGAAVPASVSDWDESVVVDSPVPAAPNAEPAREVLETRWPGITFEVSE